MDEINEQDMESKTTKTNKDNDLELIKNQHDNNNNNDSVSGYPIKEGIYLLIASMLGCLTVPVLAPAILAFFSFYMIHKRNTFKHMILPTIVGAIISLAIIIFFMHVPMFTPEVLLYFTNLELSNSSTNLQFMINAFTSLVITVMNMSVFLMILTFLHDRYGLHSSSDKQEDKLIKNAEKEESLLSSAMHHNEAKKENTNKDKENEKITIPKVRKDAVFENDMGNVDDRFEDHFNEYKHKEQDEDNELGTEDNDKEVYKTKNFVDNNTTMDKKKNTGKSVKTLDAEFEDPFESDEEEKPKDNKTATVKNTVKNTKTKKTTTKKKNTKKRKPKGK